MIAPKQTKTVEELNEEAIRITGLDNCIIGTDARGYLIYDYSLMLNHFIEEGMQQEEAMEWIDYNILGICPSNFVVLFDDFDMELTFE